jgi:hypothetical protein
MAAKKRQSSEQHSPLLKKAKLQSEDSPSNTPVQPPQQPQFAGHGVLKPAYLVTGPDKQRMEGRVPSPPNRDQTNPSPPQPEETPQQPENIDPELYAMYQEQEQNGHFDQGFGYHNHDQEQPYHATNGYQIPSLEQIANEVLVDMNGNEPSEQGPNGPLPDGFDEIRAFNATDDPVSLPNGLPHPDPKPDGSVDSAVSLPPNEEQVQDDKEAVLTNGDAEISKDNDEATLRNGDAIPNGLPHPHPSIEDSKEDVSHEETTSPEARPSTASADAKNNNTSSLPLWQPPAPLSKSPVSVKRQIVTNGMRTSISPSPAAPAPGKRKRDSTEGTPGGAKSAKKPRVDGTEEVNGAEDVQSVELARLLQQEDLGLRWRSR